MALPNLAMAFSPFAILTAEEMNDLVENIESLAAGTGLNDNAVLEAKTIVKSSYSTTEVNTGAKWTDGASIYKKTFNGTITAVSGTRSVVALTTTGLTAMLREEGYVQEADSIRMFVNGGRYPSTGVTPTAYTNVMQAGSLPSLYYLPSTSGTAIYSVTIYYLK